MCRVFVVFLSIVTIFAPTSFAWELCSDRILNEAPETFPVNQVNIPCLQNLILGMPSVDRICGVSRDRFNYFDHLEMLREHRKLLIEKLNSEEVKNNETVKDAVLTFISDNEQSIERHLQPLNEALSEIARVCVE